MCGVCVADVPIRRGIVRCAGAAVLFGSSAPAAAQLAGRVSAPMLAGLLYVGAALAVAPLVARHPPSAAALRRGGRRLAGAVVFGGAIGPLLLVAGLARTSGASASLLLNLELVFTTALAGIVFGEFLGRRIVAGTALVVVASVVLGWSGTGDVRWGALLVALACAAWALDNCVTANLDELTPAQITLVKGVVAGAANVAIGAAIGALPSPTTIAAALVVGAVGYGVSITLWVAGARELGAARGQLVFATAPFVGALVAWTVFGDVVTAPQLVAVIAGLAGVAFVIGSAHQHQHRHEAVEHEHEHDHGDGHHDHHHDPPVRGRHSHRHRHDELVHDHAHVPDLHHRHDHAA